jgi:transcriptional regulator with XRE-family HTH domain
MSEQERHEELRRFLKDRRARIRPAEAGLPTTPRRRVPGLRREEVAALAGIGVAWYTALENGDAHGVSDATLLAVADALRLSESERQYLMALAGREVVTNESVAPDPLVVDTMKAIAFPAYIITATWDVVACNAAFRRVWAVGEHEVPFNAIVM